MKSQQINDTVCNALVSILGQYKEQKLNKANCLMIYQDIFNTLVELMNGSNIQLSDEGMNFLAQHYYDSVLINNQHKLDPNIFTQRAAAFNIDKKELIILCVLLSGTQAGLELAKTIKERG